VMYPVHSYIESSLASVSPGRINKPHRPRLGFPIWSCLVALAGSQPVATGSTQIRWNIVPNAYRLGNYSQQQPVPRMFHQTNETGGCRRTGGRWDRRDVVLLRVSAGILVMLRTNNPLEREVTMKNPGGGGDSGREIGAHAGRGEGAPRSRHETGHTAPKGRQFSSALFIQFRNSGSYVLKTNKFSPPGYSPRIGARS
jgi:hypothetical protein